MSERADLTLANGQTVDEVAKGAWVLLGRTQAFRAVRVITSVGLGVALRDLKETEGALKAAGFKSFTELCDHLGLSLSNANELLKNLEDLGADMLRASDELQLTTRHLRAMRALPAGERPQVSGKHLTWNGKAYDTSKPRELEALREEFDALVRAREREARKAEKEKAEAVEHGEKQIASLKKKNDALAKQLWDAGFEANGKRVGAADGLAQAGELIGVAIAKMTGALDQAKEGKKAFHDKMCTQVIGLCEQLSRQITNQSEAAARQLDEYEG